MFISFKKKSKNSNKLKLVNKLYFNFGISLLCLLEALNIHVGNGHNFIKIISNHYIEHLICRRYSIDTNECMFSPLPFN